MTSSRPRLLVVHDDRSVLTLIGTTALDFGFDVAAAVTAGDAMAQLRYRPAHLLLFDLDMAGSPGLGAREICDLNGGFPTVLMSSDASPQRAIDAVKLGAMDYLTKPVDLRRILRILSVIRDETAQRRALLELESQIAERLELGGMVGRGPAMHHVFGLVRRLAPHARLALITGEAGSGKDTIARVLHELSPRCDGPFLRLNCSGVVETLLESELFGHVAGAFEGATADRRGLFETAYGGTILLDNIGDLSAAVQQKLLRALASSTFERLGSSETRIIDVHVIAATARDLSRDVAEGRFLPDLYDLLRPLAIDLPPLRERREDITYLAASFVRTFTRLLNKSIAGLTPGAEHRLMTSAWEGNVGELRRVLERACVLAEGELLSETDVARAMGQTRNAVVRFHSPKPVGMRAEVPAPLSEIEREHIARTLDIVNGNKAVAARLLGLSRRAFYRQLERHGLHSSTPAVRPTKSPRRRSPGERGATAMQQS